MGARGELVPRADRKAIVTSIDPVAERFADGLTTAAELAVAHEAARGIAVTVADYAGYYAAFADANDAARTWNACAGAAAYAAAGLDWIFSVWSWRIFK